MWCQCGIGVLSVINIWFTAAWSSRCQGRKKKLSLDPGRHPTAESLKTWNFQREIKLLCIWTQGWQEVFSWYRVTALPSVLSLLQSTGYSRCSNRTLLCFLQWGQNQIFLLSVFQTNCETVSKARPCQCIYCKTMTRQSGDVSKRKKKNKNMIF